MPGAADPEVTLEAGALRNMRAALKLLGDSPDAVYLPPPTASAPDFWGEPLVLPCEVVQLPSTSTELLHNIARSVHESVAVAQTIHDGGGCETCRNGRCSIAEWEATLEPLKGTTRK